MIATDKALPIEYVPPKVNVMNAIFLVFVVLVMTFAVSAGLTGCLSANDRYRTAILMCVERSTTLSESKACRANVDFQFGLKDGGSNDR